MCQMQESMCRIIKLRALLSGDEMSLEMELSGKLTIMHRVKDQI